MHFQELGVQLYQKPVSESSTGRNNSAAMALPDSRACWPVAVSMAIYVFFGMVLVKSEAVIYVGFMEMLHVDRQDASWPLTLAIIMSQMAGPLYGVLNACFSERMLLVFGALLCALPVMLCSLANSLALVVFLYGILFGLGIACEEVIPFTVVARHFVKYRGSAMSLLFVVTSVSGFVSPLISEALRQALDFRLALLVLGALQFSMLLGCVFVDRVPRSTVRSGDQDAAESAAATPLLSRKEGSVGVIPYTEPGSKSLVASLKTPKFVAAGDQQSVESNPLLVKAPASTAGSTLVRNLRSLATVAFVHIGTSRAVTVFVLISFTMTAVDFGKDNGLKDFQAVSLVTSGALGDLVSRTGTGFLLDYKLLSGEAVMLWGFGIQAVALAGMSLLRSYWLLLVSCFFVGMSGGGRIFACTVMVSDRFDQDSLPLSLGAMNFIAGIACLARPPLIGYVRDVLGSYNLLFMAFAITNTIFTVTWTFALFWERCRCGNDKRELKDFTDGNQHRASS